MEPMAATLSVIGLGARLQSAYNHRAFLANVRAAVEHQSSRDSVD
jgi:hypothetical protein